MEGVDDLDKSASLVVGEAPPRSTSSLGAMLRAGRRAFLAAAIAGYFSLLSGCHTSALTPASQFRDDWKGLFLAVTKGFGARTYYVGSDETWSYFQTRFENSIITPTYRKVMTSQMRLRRTFPFRQSEPYLVELSDFGCDKDCHPL
jgi:hypothetical protein